MGLTDTYVRFCFDEACLTFGNGVQEAMDQVKHKNPKLLKGKKENVLREYLGLPKKYRDIMELVKRKAIDVDRPDPPFKKG